MFGKKDVASVATIHYSLGDVNSRSSDVESVVNVPDLIDCPAVDPHPQTNIGILFEFLTDFQCTTHRFFRALKEKQRHSVTGRHTDQLAGGFSFSKALGASDNATELLDCLDLLVYQQFGIPDNVD